MIVNKWGACHYDSIKPFKETLWIDPSCRRFNLEISSQQKAARTLQSELLRENPCTPQ